MQVFCLDFGVRVLCFVQAKTCRYDCMYFFHCTRDCVCRSDGDGICICVRHDLNQCSGWWYVCSVNVK